MKKGNLKVKIECIIFILIVFCMGQVFSVACGDADSSGVVDIVDALVIAKVYVGLTPPPNYSAWAADVDGDGNILIIDALQVAQFYVGSIDILSGCSQTPTPTNGTTATPTPTQVSTPTATPLSGTYDCSDVPIWTETDHYEKTGTRVYYNGKLYENRWHSENENPEQNSGEYEVWKLIGTCDPNLTPEPKATPFPTVSWQGTPGYASRFWDCCKPHCSWKVNVAPGMEPLRTCLKDGKSINPNPDAVSSCEGGDSYVCYSFIPWVVADDLSYGFAATSSGDVCGKCFEMQFTGKGHYSDTPGAVALKGKRMIVQAINIGYDVGGGQFDILVPGGGVGAFDGCSTQWGISKSLLGVQFGGFLSECMLEHGYYDHTALKECLRAKNNEIFRNKGLTEMAEGLDWFIDWFEAADNPALIFREVPCPQELIDISEMERP